MFLLSFAWANIQGQSRIVDEIVAVVGDKRILYSDIEQEYLQKLVQGEKPNENARCTILEGLLVQKLLIHQAEVDSIDLTESQIDAELNSRMQYFINSMGSEEKLEAYFKKSTVEIKKDLRQEIRDQMLASRMRAKVVENLTITPSDVKAYIKSLPEDSLPYVDAEVEFNQILIYPHISERATIEAREKLLDLRERIVKGESFATLAVIYSEDQGSAVRGGDIGWMAKAELDPEYAKAAFALKKGTISKIVESSFGFHLIQCLDRTEDRVQTRHILLRPKIEPDEKIKAVSRLDSIVRLVRQDSLKFERAALLFSQDPDTRLNGGQAVNPYRGGRFWKMDEFEPNEYAIISKLNIGELSDPYQTFDVKGKLVYKVIWLKDRTNPHMGNLKDDYNMFKSMTTQVKQDEVISSWVEDKMQYTYIRIAEQFRSCSFRLKGWVK